MIFFILNLGWQHNRNDWNAGASPCLNTLVVPTQIGPKIKKKNHSSAIYALDCTVSCWKSATTPCSDSSRALSNWFSWAIGQRVHKTSIPQMQLAHKIRSTLDFFSSPKEIVTLLNIYHGVNTLKWRWQLPPKIRQSRSHNGNVCLLVWPKPQLTCFHTCSWEEL